MTIISNLAAVPQGYLYYDVSKSTTTPLRWGTILPTPGEGDYIIPETTTNDGRYHQYTYHSSGTWGDIPYTNSWIGSIQSRYANLSSQQAPLANSIGGKPVGVFLYNDLQITSAPDLSEYTNLFYVSFGGDSKITTIPNLPPNLKSLDYAFSKTSVSNISKILSLTKLKNMAYTFWGSKVTTVPDMSSMNTVEDMTGTFYNCNLLTSVSALPSNVVKLTYTFKYCSALVSSPVIPETVTDINETFNGCTALSGFILIQSNTITNYLKNTFKDTVNDIVLVTKTTGSSNYETCRRIADASPSNVYNGVKAITKTQTAIRCLSDGTEDSQGAYVKITVYFECEPTSKTVLFNYITLKENGTTISNIAWHADSLSSSTLSSGDDITSYSKFIAVVPTTEGGVFSYILGTKYNSDYGLRYIVYGEKSVTVTYSDFLIDISPEGKSVGIFKEASDNDEGLLVGKTIKNLGEVLTYDYTKSPEKAISVVNNGSEVANIDWNGNVEATGSLKGADVLINGISVADFVIEQGTSGNWSYRKYNSGIYEAWYTGTNTFAIDGRFSAASPVLYYGAIQNLSLPFAVTSIQYVDVKAFYSNWGVWTAITQANSSGIKYQSLSAVARTSVTYAIRGYIKGTYSLT